MTGSGRTPGPADTRLRVLIVGAGITGLLAAVRCAQAGCRVTVFDRGPIPHPQSTSFDQHRALRALTVGDPVATARATDLHRRWQQIDDLLRDGPAAAPLYRRVGVITALHPDTVSAALATAEAAVLPLRVTAPAHHPHVGFPAGAAAVLEPQAGVLLAERLLHAAVRWLRRQPRVTLRPGSEVIEVRTDPGRVHLSGGAREGGDVVLVTAGPWSASLLGLPVTVHRQTMVYLRPPADLVRIWARAPIAGGIGRDGRSWLLPAVTGTLLKISTDAARRVVAGVSRHPDPGDWTGRIMSTGALTDLHRYQIVLSRDCHYATAPGGDAGFVRVGAGVWARPASGGDGFRTAPHVVDTIADDLALGGSDRTVTAG